MDLKFTHNILTSTLLIKFVIKYFALSLDRSSLFSDYVIFRYNFLFYIEMQYCSNASERCISMHQDILT